MSSSGSVHAAATALAAWAHQRRRRWTDEALPSPQVLEIKEIQEIHQVLEVPWVPEVPEVLAVPEVPQVPEVPEVHETPVFLEEPAIEYIPQLPHFEERSPVSEVSLPEFEPVLAVHADTTPDAPTLQLTPIAEPPRPFDTISLFQSRSAHAPLVEHEIETPADHSETAGTGARAFGALQAGGSFAATFGSYVVKAASGVGRLLVAALERVGPFSDVALWCLTRGAALVSTASVVLLLTLHRSDFMPHWNRLTETVAGRVAAAAAATRPAPPPPPVPLPPGSGRLIIASSDDSPQVVIDGKPRGSAPITVILPAGTHRLLVRSAKGSIERSVHVDVGETMDIKEEIFPGWVAVSSAIDLTLSENGKTLKRDERGWAILSPGPHDIRLDNSQLGIHETRHVVVMPGDATRISLAPPGSTLSITANEPAEVWVDGTSLGEAPVNDAPVKLGMHDVRVRSASHEKWLRVRVTTQPAQLNVDLTAE
jgi:PEGA domain-containing protein